MTKKGQKVKQWSTQYWKKIKIKHKQNKQEHDI